MSDPIIATATTRIVPTPKDEKIALPEKNMPAMAAMTVKPEISTARPEVAAAMSRASADERPFSCSSFMRRR